MNWMGSLDRETKNTYGYCGEETLWKAT